MSRSGRSSSDATKISARPTDFSTSALFKEYSVCTLARPRSCASMSTASMKTPGSGFESLENCSANIMNSRSAKVPNPWFAVGESSQANNAEWCISFPSIPRIWNADPFLRVSSSAKNLGDEIILASASRNIADVYHAFHLGALAETIRIQVPPNTPDPRSFQSHSGYLSTLFPEFCPTVVQQFSIATAPHCSIKKSQKTLGQDWFDSPSFSPKDLSSRRVTPEIP